MNAKMILCTLLVLVSIQGLYGKGVALIDEKTLVDQYLKAILDSAMDAISNLTGRLQQFVESAVGNLNQIVNGLLAGAQDIVAGATTAVRDILDALMDKLGSLLNSGEISAECAGARQQEIQELLQGALSNITECAAAVPALALNLTDDVQQLFSSVTDLLAGASLQIHACVPGHVGLVDIPLIAACVTAKLTAIVDVGQGLVGLISGALGDATHLAANALASVTACVKEVEQGVLGGALLIGQELTGCVDTSTNGASGTSAPVTTSL